MESDKPKRDTKPIKLTDTELSILSKIAHEIITKISYL